MTQFRVECDCGFTEQTHEMKNIAAARRVMEEHQEECDEYVTIWEAVHTSKLTGN